jgi:hypothetical protein
VFVWWDEWNGLRDKKGDHVVKKTTRIISKFMPAKNLKLTLMLCASLVAVFARGEAKTRDKYYEDNKPLHGGSLALSEVYAVYVNDEKIPVYSTPVEESYHNIPHLKVDKTYSFTSFDCDGPVKVRVVCTEPVSELSVRSVDKKVPVKINGKEASFTLNGTGNFLIEKNGKGRKDPLLLFANPRETNIPDKNDPDVIYFGKGLHNAGLISLRSNQTLYIEAGAIVTGKVEARGDNIRICGRGILENTGEKEGDEYYRSHLISLEACKNVTLEGIILNKKSRGWTTLVKGCDGVHVNYVKICGSRAGNDDGFDPVNSKNMMIENCLIRTADDCLAFKGMDDERSNCENITVRHCMLWSDRCCAILLGDECRADFMRNIVVEDCFIPYLSCEGFPKKFLMLHAGEEISIEKIRLENIEIGGEGQERNYIEMTCEYNRYSKTKTAGNIRDILLKNVHLTGDEGGYHIVMRGYDQQHIVESVTFENCTMNGKSLSQSYPGLQFGDFVKNIRFK